VLFHWGRNVFQFLPFACEGHDHRFAVVDPQAGFARHRSLLLGKMSGQSKKIPANGRDFQRCFILSPPINGARPGNKRHRIEIRIWDFLNFAAGCQRSLRPRSHSD
jgi:hypothetical protein